MAEVSLAGFLGIGIVVAMACALLGLFLLELSLLASLAIYALSGAGAVLVFAWAKMRCPSVS